MSKSASNLSICAKGIGKRRSITSLTFRLPFLFIGRSNFVSIVMIYKVNLRKLCLRKDSEHFLVDRNLLLKGKTIAVCRYCKRNSNTTAVLPLFSIFYNIGTLLRTYQLHMIQVLLAKALQSHLLSANVVCVLLNILDYIR